jgi:hypothetical protein
MWEGPYIDDNGFEKAGIRKYCPDCAIEKMQINTKYPTGRKGYTDTKWKVLGYYINYLYKNWKHANAVNKQNT